ncbi:hypothetical protein L1987_76347 [Smallanthus sonchifolius]|uniref:Uncharacterized protein n=1 Tax=Smallanthus sonchifolius TaxID=185202 RepID=A0ACB9A8A7_9ASTR|nr:hypothetical protein L1987_76347 [Smallanthus sonchifolius]
MKPMEDVWNDITSLSSPITNHFQTFFAPAYRPPGDSTNFLPPPPASTTTMSMLTLLTPTNSVHEDPNKRLKPNQPPCSFTSPSEHSEKFRRLMKNRESADRSRARKQARVDELEHEVKRLAKENAYLKRLQKEEQKFKTYGLASTSHQKRVVESGSVLMRLIWMV